MLKENILTSTFFVILLIATFIFIYYGTDIYTDETNYQDELTEDGIYRGEAEGFRGDILVEVQVEDNEIIDIKIIKHQDTEEYAEPAFAYLKEEMLDKQTHDVDIYSGSTVTSEAVIEAVEEALEKADFNEN